MHNDFIKSIASTHYFIKAITSSPGYTIVLRLVHDNTRPLVGCLENSDRKVKQFRVIPRIASSRLAYCSSIQCPNLNVSGSATGLPIRIPKLSRNGHCANRMA